MTPEKRRTPERNLDHPEAPNRTVFNPSFEFNPLTKQTSPLSAKDRTQSRRKRFPSINYRSERFNCESRLRRTESFRLSRPSSRTGGGGSRRGLPDGFTVPNLLPRRAEESNKGATDQSRFIERESSTLYLHLRRYDSRTYDSVLLLLFFKPSKDPLLFRYR